MQQWTREDHGSIDPQTFFGVDRSGPAVRLSDYPAPRERFVVRVRLRVANFLNRLARRIAP